MSSDNEFEDPYNISSEENVGPLEIESTGTIQSTMPDENESKPNKSISRSLSTHLGLLKSKIGELRNYLDSWEAVKNVDDHVIEYIQSKSNWIEAKASKITTQWEEFLETDYDDDELARAEPTYNECGDLSSKIRDRADKFIREKKSRTAQAVTSTLVNQASSYTATWACC